MTERSYHHGNLREALLDRAWESIDAGGVDALSLRQLARDVGVSHGASARHFSDRTALLDAVAVAGFTRMNEALAAAVEQAAPFGERLRAAGLAYIGFAVAHPAILEVMYKAKHQFDASGELRERSRASMSMVVAFVAAAQAAGEIPEGDAERRALVIFASVHGVAALATADLLDGVPWQDAAEATIEVILGSLGVE
ncbi:MAG: TetR/AcrR family transcriptional regulator [Microbacterium sp.]|uniref:AcrR family transcriptional regulator n=1 Tax=Microbacterium natoriense TaxID=284570 RepID=A0AAW8EUY7_9MICO|nr:MULTISPECIES: TetR/AcrR family transcriptional regulator [Microbacterium]MBW8762034.1 TetR/AcrR family transcriptional regulator [Microbacterium sp.]MDQ0647121.1 AcrR family transcriptional regulator [Microbacterium natoriense]